MSSLNTSLLFGISPRDFQSTTSFICLERSNTNYKKLKNELQNFRRTLREIDRFFMKCSENNFKT